MSSQRQPHNADIRKSVIRRERRDDGDWIAYEPEAQSEVVGRAKTEPDVVIDYVERLRGGDDR